MKNTKATMITVSIGETGEHQDYTAGVNNHRITVVRMDSGHVGLRFSRLPHRDGCARVDERTEAITPYPLAGALPAIAEALRMHAALKRD